MLSKVYNKCIFIILKYFKILVIKMDCYYLYNSISLINSFKKLLINNKLWMMSKCLEIGKLWIFYINWYFVFKVMYLILNIMLFILLIFY